MENDPGVGWGDDKIRKAWIDYQNARARETETQSSNIIKLLDGLVREYVMKMKDLGSDNMELEYYPDLQCEVWKYTHQEYALEIVKTRPEVLEDKATGDSYMRTLVEFVATPKDIVYAFDRFCKNNGIRNPYGNASIFGERLKNDRSLMEKAGWELVPSPRANVAPHWKVVDGRRFWKFRKTIVR
jgi:DNA primase